MLFMALSISGAKKVAGIFWTFFFYFQRKLSRIFIEIKFCEDFPRQTKLKSCLENFFGHVALNLLLLCDSFQFRTCDLLPFWCSFSLFLWILSVLEELLLIFVLCLWIWKALTIILEFIVLRLKVLRYNLKI